MEQSQRGQSPVSPEQLLILMTRLGDERAVKRQALKDVSDELRLVARRASACGISDAKIARATGAALTSVRVWLGKGNDG